MIEIKNIHKSYGSLEVLKGIDAVIEQGEIVSICLLYTSDAADEL